MAKVSGGGTRIVFGAILVLIGLLLLLSQMRVLHFWDFVGTWWPSILIVLGLWHWANRRFRPSAWALLLILLGVFLQAVELDLLGRRGFGVMAGGLLIILGLWILLRHARTRVETVSDADSVDQWTIFGGVEEALNTQRFTGGTVSVAFGGVELDLRQAALAPGGVTLNLTAIFGGIEVRVPENWHVIVDGTAILGGVEDKTGTVSPDKLLPDASLRIRAVTIFGGVEISR
jgi:predicted membrane protein